MTVLQTCPASAWLWETSRHVAYVDRMDDEAKVPNSVLQKDAYEASVRFKDEDTRIMPALGRRVQHLIPA